MALHDSGFIKAALATLKSNVARMWDDGSGFVSGHVAATVVGGNDLAMISFIPGQWLSTITGSNSCVYVEGGSKNPDGSESHIIMTRKAGAQQTCMVDTYLYGNTIGFRWERLTGGGIPIVTINGVSYRPPEPNPKINGVDSAIVDAASYWIVARDLGDGPHHVRVQLEPNLGADTTINAYGWLLEKAAGYEKKAPRATITWGPILTTSPAAINHGGSSTNPGGFLSNPIKVIYANISASPAKVIIKQGSNIIWQKTIAAGESDEFNFGAPEGLVSVTHEASANSAINPTTIGLR